MIQSVHNPNRGGFDYFEAPDSVPINDDFPTPRLGKLRTKLGVPADEALRPLAPSARLVGHGSLPKGSLCSAKRGTWSGSSTLASGLGLDMSDIGYGVLVGAGLGGAAGLAFGVANQKNEMLLMLLGAIAGAGAAKVFWP